MKTTLDIADNTLKQAKELARRERATLRALVEEGLELVLKARASKPPYRSKPVTFSGRGLTPAYRDASWEKIRDEIHKGRGS